MSECVRQPVSFDVQNNNYVSLVFVPVKNIVSGLGFGDYLGFRIDGFRDITPVMENQMEKNMENQMEAFMYRM